jgi:hypothetical protein
MFGLDECQPLTPDRWLNEGERVNVGNVTLQVLHCPGHTPGHIVFFDDQSRLLISGDVIFKGGVGRSDFPRGDHGQLIQSIKQKLLPLGDDVTFIPGHGPMSTLGMNGSIIRSFRMKCLSGNPNKKSLHDAGFFMRKLQYGDNRFAQRRHVVRRHACNVHAARGHGVHAKLFTQTQNLLFGQAAEREHAVLFDDKAEVAVRAFLSQGVHKQQAHALNALTHIVQLLFPDSAQRIVAQDSRNTDAPCAGGLE